MGKRRRNRLLVPEAREALDALMRNVVSDTLHQGAFVGAQTQVVDKVANLLGIPYRENGDNGNLTTRQAGRIGGKIGGNMVQKLVKIAQQELSEERLQDGGPHN